MDGVIEIAEKINRNEAILITSHMLDVELLPCNLPSNAISLIDRFFKRKNIQKKPFDGRISPLAQQIRNKHPKLSSSDSIHLATAIYYQADQFHTFDNGGKGGLSLISLNGNVAGYPLVICKPPITQYKLPGI